MDYKIKAVNIFYVIVNFLLKIFILFINLQSKNLLVIFTFLYSILILSNIKIILQLAAIYCKNDHFDNVKGYVV